MFSSRLAFALLVVTAAFTSAAAPRALQDALDPAQLIEMCATGGSDAVAKAVNEMYADVGSGSIDENVPMIIDGPATGRCICSDTFSASTMTALVDGSDPTAALQVCCSRARPTARPHAACPAHPAHLYICGPLGDVHCRLPGPLGYDVCRPGGDARCDGRRWHGCWCFDGEHDQLHVRDSCCHVDDRWSGDW